MHINQALVNNLVKQRNNNADQAAQSGAECDVLTYELELCKIKLKELEAQVLVFEEDTMGDDL